MKIIIQSLLTVIFVSILIGCKTTRNEYENKGVLKINSLQVIGSHNSYKQAIEPSLLQIIQKQTAQSFEELQYSHVSLREQLEKYKLRNLEIDVVYDPMGGRYANPLGLSLLKEQGIDPMSYDTKKRMNSKGFKTIHVPDIDFRTSCLRLTDCLNQIKDWSDQNPNHLPICITFNTKASNIDKPGFTKLLGFSTKALDSLDNEIASVIPKDRIIKPDDVRGDFNTLEEAVKAFNWPNLKDARGKFILVLDEHGAVAENYIAGHPSLKGRLMFTASSPGTPEAAFIIKNNPIKDQENIKALVRVGYMVRTRADADTKEARNGDYSRFKAALSSGAQFISTDYYKKDTTLGTSYKIAMPNGVVGRCNPVLSNKNCNKKNFEE